MGEEAVEGSIIPVTTVNFMPNGGMEQNSTGDSIRSSSLSPARSDEKVLSRYLKPSMGSCHDLCKYGKKHDSEAKVRRANFRAFLKKNLVRDGVQNQVTSPNPGERRKTAVIKLETTSTLETEFSDNPEAPKLQTLPPTKNSTASGDEKTPQTSHDNEQSLTTLSPGERRMTAVIKLETKSMLETEFTDNPKAPKLQTPSPTKNSTASGNKKTLQTSHDNEQRRMRSLNPGEEKSKLITRRTPLQHKSSPNKLNAIKLKDLSPASVISASGEPNIIKKKTKLPVRKTISSVVPKAIEQKAPPSIRKPQVIKQKASLPPKRVDVATKTTVTLKTRTPLIRSISQLKSSRSLIAQRNQDNKIMKSLETSKIGERKVLKLPTSSFSKSSWSLIARKDQENRTVKSLRTSKIGERNVLKPSTTSFSSKYSRSLIARRNQESDIKKSFGASKIGERKLLKPPTASFSSKTPHYSVSSLKPRKLRNMKRSSSVKNKDKTGKANTESKPDNNLVPNQKIEESESAICGVRDEEIEGNNKIDVSKGNDNMRLRRTTTARPEDNTSTPYKLKFRKSKVINFRSDSIGARRLWFNIGRIAGENPNGNGLLWRRNFRKKRDMVVPDSKVPNSEAQSVVLKHQDVTEKKDTQALFNHVIEETASKLVETRKSKVMALVGAFETVISLQESKPASAV